MTTTVNVRTRAHGCSVIVGSESPVEVPPQSNQDFHIDGDASLQLKDVPPQAEEEPPVAAPAEADKALGRGPVTKTDRES